MATKLRDLTIRAVALADMGANYDPETGEGAHILLYKRADAAGIAKDDPTPADVHTDTYVGADGKRRKKKPPKETDVAKDQSEPYWKAQYTADQRAAMAKKGEAIPIKNADGDVVDGSFPIANVDDLKNAIKAYGRAGDKAEAKAHIMKRAKALGQSDLIPEAWTSTKKAAGRRLLASIAKMVGLSGDKLETVLKDWDEASTFDEEFGEQEWWEVLDEMYDRTAALTSAIGGTLRDETVDPAAKEQYLRTSLAQFMASVTAAIPSWVQGNTVDDVDALTKSGKKISAERLDRLQRMQEELTAILADSESSTPEPVEQTAGSGKEGDMPEEFDKSTLDEDATKYVDALEKRATDAETAKTDLEKRVADLLAAAKSGETEPPADPFEKALADPNVPEPVKVAMRAEHDARVKAEKEAADEREIAKRERDERITKEFVEKARSFRALPIDAQEYGPVLKTLSETDAEAYAKIEALLKAADEAMVAGNLFSIRGSDNGGGDAGTAMDVARSKAAELMKSEKDLTEQQAIAKVFADDEDLYSRHRQEQRKSA